MKGDFVVCKGKVGVKIMARIVHIGVKVDDLEKATEFYKKTFGFVEVQTGQVRDHTSRHLSDGAIDLALIKYDSEDSAESRASGLGPCIHHFGIEVDDMDHSAEELAKYGCEIISAPGVIPIKFRAPGGTVAEIVPQARYKKRSEETK
jgi:lactoylglutathione lyase